MADHCPGSTYFEGVEDKMDTHVDQGKVEVREYTKSINDLCGQIKILIKVICWAFIPAIVCICVIAMGEKLTSMVSRHVPTVPIAQGEGFR